MKLFKKLFSRPAWEDRPPYTAWQTVFINQGRRYKEVHYGWEFPKGTWLQRRLKEVRSGAKD